ncbi:hypothetical protein MK489_07425 [Myxococcota bacterium]|nr:hypothetical protein [Myxococcota bacterium]
MIQSNRNHVLIAGLTAFTLWPLVHMAAVAQWDINPWKLGGWAMYSVPVPRVEVSLQASAGPDETWGAVDRLPGPVGEELERFWRLRRSLGSLSRPNRLAERFFEHIPHATQLRVNVITLRIDPQTAMMKEEHIGFTFARDPSTP